MQGSEGYFRKNGETLDFRIIKLGAFVPEMDYSKLSGA
tara:strand:- start:505 stop:618 length:114 start_codon:yes stop_codon:yes gene_type:complete